MRRSHKNEARIFYLNSHRAKQNVSYQFGNTGFACDISAVRGRHTSATSRCVQTQAEDMTKQLEKEAPQLEE